MGETPGPIPNPEAKTRSADGTAPGRVWESRTPPDHTTRVEPPHHTVRGLPAFNAHTQHELYGTGPHPTVRACAHPWAPLPPASEPDPRYGRRSTDRPLSVTEARDRPTADNAGMDTTDHESQTPRVIEQDEQPTAVVTGTVAMGELREFFDRAFG